MKKIIFILIVLIFSTNNIKAHTGYNQICSDFASYFRINEHFRSHDINLDFIKFQFEQSRIKELGHFSIFPDLYLSIRTGGDRSGLKAKSTLLDIVNRAWYPPNDTNSVLYHRITLNALILDNTGFTTYYKKWINCGYEIGIQSKGANYAAISLGPYIAGSSIRFNNDYFSSLKSYSTESFGGFEGKIQANIILSTGYLRLENLSSASRLFDDVGIYTYTSESNIRIPLSKIFRKDKREGFDYSDFNLKISHKYQEYEIKNFSKNFHEFKIGLNWRGYI